MVALEALAFSLPVARGDCFWTGIAAPGLGLVAWASGSPWLVRMRVLVAMGAAAYAFHPILSGLQIAVAAGWWAVGRPPRWFLLGLWILAGLVAPFLDPGSIPQGRDPEGLTVATWNAGYPWTGKFVLLPEPDLVATGVDLLVLQEVGWAGVDPAAGDPESRRLRRMEEAVRGLGERIGLFHFWSDGPLEGRARPFRGGSAVLSRWPIREVRDPEGSWGSVPPPLLSIAGTPIGEVRLQPIHLWRPPGLAPEEAGAALKRLAADLVARAEGASVFLVGDTNTFPWTRHRGLEAHGLIEAWSSGSGYGGTWPSWWPVVRLDTVYGDSRTRCTGWRVLGNYRSDHRALVARYRLR